MVGAGAAGISLALSFLGAGVDVLLLESGGLDVEDKTQALYAGESVGREYYPLEACRVRCFGGTTNHWGGRSQPLAAWDLTERPWVPHSGWPISIEALSRYYPDAQRLCSLGPYSYGAEVWADICVNPPAMDTGRLTSTFWRYSAVRRPELIGVDAVRFGRDYREIIRRAKNIRVLLHANLSRIRLTPNGRAVDRLEVRALGGEPVAVRAKRYILACGGIENARLLLESDDIDPMGVGNNRDLVGRFFMEHPDVITGEVRQMAFSPAARIFSAHLQAGRAIRPGVRLSPVTQAREKVLACASALSRDRDPNNPTNAFHAVRDDLGRGRWSRRVREGLHVLVDDPEGLSSDIRVRAKAGKLSDQRTHRLQISTELEQAPNPLSRITLSGERDALGQRRTRLDWRFTALDKRSLLVHTRTIGLEFARLGLGHVRIADWLLAPGDAWGEDMHGSYHHMGTTRMADDPANGVVDRDCRVHGVGNLFVIGGSVFPTAGPTNPTFSIVALALRLGDHLKAQLAPGAKLGLPADALVFRTDAAGVPEAPPMDSGADVLETSS